MRVSVYKDVVRVIILYMRVRKVRLIVSIASTHARVYIYVYVELKIELRSAHREKNSNRGRWRELTIKRLEEEHLSKEDTTDGKRESARVSEKKKRKKRIGKRDPPNTVASRSF